MEYFLSNDNFSAAEGIYANGANSMKTSEISLLSPLTQTFSKGAILVQGGAEGVLNKDAAAGNQTIYIGIKTPCISQYAPNPDTSGCFAVNGGESLTIDGVNVGPPESVNLKYRTLKGFSTAAGSKMVGMEPFETYKAYYGAPDYADKFISAALQGANETGLNVQVDFSGKDDNYRAESAEKGTVLWSVWMYLIWEMEDAIGDCINNCENCNDAPVHAWDEAWAFYTGSLEGPYGNPAGIFSYRLAENLCAEFGTCLAGKSKVNRELITKFLDGKDLLDQGQCNAARAFEKDIITLMSIPLIQGTLQSAYKIAHGDSSSKSLAEGVAFVGSIIPQLNNCSSVDATTVMNRMWMDGDMGGVDGFGIVKAAFENNYACMGVTSADIGTYVDEQ